MRLENILIIFVLLIISVNSVISADFTPQGNIDLKGIYSIKNVTNITSNLYCNITNCYALASFLSGNSYYPDGIYIIINGSNYIILNETKLNITIEALDTDTTYSNLSEFYDDLGNRGFTHLSNFTDNLGFYNQSSINSSELTNQGDGKLGILDSFINLLIDNRITQAFIKALGFYDNTEVYNKTEINSFNDSWTSTYNATYAGLINNESYLSTFNQTYHNYVVANQSNSTTWWASISGFLTTYLFKNGNSLDLNETKLNQTILLKASVYNDTAMINSVNTTINIQNLGFYNKSQIDNNLSLYLLLTDQRFNETSLINSVNTTANIQALGFYTKSQVDNNLSLYLLLTDQRYNETSQIASVNTTINIQNLGFYNKSQVDNNLSLYLLLTDQRFNETNYINTIISNNNASWSSTYNVTYHTWAYNQTTATFNIYNATWDNSFMNIWNYNQTTSAINDINSRFWNRTQSYNKTDIDTQIITNNSYFSTYNLTYAGCINNASYLSTYNTTYDATTNQWNGNSSALIGCVNNASYLSTYNSTYAGYSFGASNETLATYNLWNAVWLSTYNSTYASWAYNQTLATYNLWNTVWLSTYNSTYAANLDTNDSAYIASQTSNWLSTYNSTYAGYSFGASNETLAAYNLWNAVWLSTYNSTYAGYSLNVSINYTLNTFNAYDTRWTATYNSTYNTLLNQNCANGKVVNGTLANGTFICTTPTASMDYTNIALTNISETWDTGQNITTGAGGWFKGLFNWVLGSLNGYLYGSFNGTTLTLNFNTTTLNNTISTQGVILGFNSTYNSTYAGSVNNASYLSTYNSTYNTWAYNQTIPAQSYANTNFFNKSADIVTNSYNITTTQINATSYLITAISGACDLTKVHSICSNATGTYVVG